MRHSIGLTFFERPLFPKGVRQACAVALVWWPALVVAKDLAIPSNSQATTALDGDAPPTANSTEPKLKPRLRGALTMLVGWGPDYLGAATQSVWIKPGFLLRYGRWSLSSNGAFAASPDPEDGEEPVRGLGLNLLGNEHDWLRLSLRVDSGRRSKGVNALNGIDDVPRTLRMRVSGHIELGHDWGLTPGLNLDLLNRGVGHTLDMSLGRDWVLSPRLKFTGSAGLTLASRQYLNSYFGVTPTESQASGYALYSPSAGLQDLRLGVGLRYDINPRWVTTLNASVQHLTGPAADSPITRSKTHWGASAGIGWRF